MTPEKILKEAASLVAGERAKQHGDYTTLHSRIASLWSSYLKFEVRPEQVALCMVLVKISRDEVGEYNPDDAVDAAAYVALWGALNNLDSNNNIVEKSVFKELGGRSYFSGKVVTQEEKTNETP